MRPARVLNMQGLPGHFLPDSERFAALTSAWPWVAALIHAAHSELNI